MILLFKTKRIQSQWKSLSPHNLSRSCITISFYAQTNSHESRRRRSRQKPSRWPVVAINRSEMSVTSWTLLANRHPVDQGVVVVVVARQASLQRCQAYFEDCSGNTRGLVQAAAINFCAILVRAQSLLLLLPLLLLLLLLLPVAQSATETKKIVVCQWPSTSFIW